MNKKITQSLFLLMVFISFSGIGKMYAQEQKYQLRNSDFDTPFVAAPGTSATGTEPLYWHSFGSVTGSLASTARSGAQISQSSDTRTSTGFSCKINARSILGIATANGNMTTGRINAGNMTASNAANHNFTDPSDNNFNEPWTSTPDSIRFWAKYTPNSATQWARMSVFIHDSYKFTDPLAGDANSSNYIVAGAELEWQRGDQGWHQYTAPFDYASYAHLGKSPKYILITFTTNKTPGSGNASDALYIDDIEMIYSAWLADLKINGQTIAGFETGLLTYGGPKLTGEAGSYAFPYQPEDFSWTPTSKNIRGVEVTNVPGTGGDADGGYTSILVTAEDGIATKEYKIMYSSGFSDDNSLTALSYTIDGENAIPVPNFNPATLTYNISITDPEEIRVPKILEESIVLSDESAEIFDINQPTGVNAAGSVTVRAENLSLKVYTLNFSKTVSTNSELSWLKIGGTDVADFAADKLEYEYEITTCVSANNQFPTVTYEKSSYWANVVYTQATMATPTATIEVTAENGSKTTYTVNFILKNDNAGLLGYRINSTNRNNTFTTTNNYTDTYSASFTAVPTLSLSTTTAQQGCAGSNAVFSTPFVWYPDTNKIVVTAQNGIATQEYGTVIKNTNCYLTTGAGNGLKYKYNGVIYNTINITSSNNSNNNAVTITVTLPVGPNESAELIDANPQAPVVSDIVYTQPATRAGSGSVKITANDGTANKTYNVNFTQTLSNVATLSNITYNNGDQVLGFTSAQENYTVLITSNITEVPQFTGIPSFEWLPAGNIVYHQATSFEDAATITVTAENGTTVKTYTINFEVIEPENDAYLLALMYDNIEVPNFNPSIFNYTVSIPYNQTTPPVLSAITTSPTAIPFYVQPANDSYMGRVLVFSENTKVTKIYTVNFIKELSPETAIEAVKYEYDNQLYTYNVTESGTEITIALPAETEGEPVISEIILLDNRATYQIDEQASESNDMTATVTVTAEDGTEETYSIAFEKTLSGSTLLTEIRYDGILLEDFDPNTLTYSVIVPSFLPTREVTATPAWINTDVQIFYSTLSLYMSATYLVADIIVTSENGENTITYTVIFEYELVKSNNANLESISIDGNLIADFDENTTEYAVELPANYFGTPVVTAVSQDENASVMIDYFSQVHNKVIITVTAEDSETVKTYQVTFSYETNDNANLASISVDGNLIADFDENTTEYVVVLPANYSGTPVVTATPAWINADVQIVWLMVNCVNYCPIFAIAEIIVTSENGENTVTYTIYFEREPVKSDNANLASISVDGILIADFDENTTEYAVELPANYFGTPVVTAISQDENASVMIDYFSQVHNKVIITVTAEDSETVKTYQITFSYETVGISEIVANNFTFYPNPVIDVLNVETDQPSALQIIDSNGRIILTKNVTEAAKIDVSNLVPGIYAILVDGVFGGKFVKL